MLISDKKSVSKSDELTIQEKERRRKDREQKFIRLKSEVHKQHMRM